MVGCLSRTIKKLVHLLNFSSLLNIDKVGHNLSESKIYSKINDRKY